MSNQLREEEANPVAIGDEGDGGDGVPRWVVRTLDRHERNIEEISKAVSNLIGKLAIIMILVSAVVSAAVAWIFSR